MKRKKSEVELILAALERAGNFDAVRKIRERIQKADLSDGMIGEVTRAYDKAMGKFTVRTIENYHEYHRN